MREYLGPVVKADPCAKNVDDTGVTAENATDVTQNLRAVFESIRPGVLKLLREKCILESDKLYP